MRLRYLVFICIGMCTFMASGRDVVLSLKYDYFPGEPYWAVYGSIQSRSFTLSVGRLKTPELGRIRSSGADDFHRILPGEGTEKYFADAITRVLTGYGIRFSPRAAYHLALIPEFVRITTADHEEDGLKRCVVRFAVRLTGPGKAILFSAVVENEGVSEIDDDDEDGYADMVNMVIHGAMTNLWGSQALFAAKPLGNGWIVKKSMGTYGFIPSRSLRPVPAVDTATGTPATTDTLTPGPVFDSFDSFNTGEPGVGTRLTADYAGSDSVVIPDGRKLSLGVLPVNNATGQYALNPIVVSCREALVDILSRSRTVKIMERDRMEDILKEQALGLTGIMNDSTVVKVGNIFGVRAMLAVGLTSNGGYYRLTGRIINVETSALVVSVSVDAPDANSITDAVPELAAKLMLAFSGEKLSVSRNTMSYPTTCPVAVSAATASVEDAWAVEKNPAALMKINRRDAQFFISLASQVSGSIDTFPVRTSQPPYSNIGVNLALPVSSRFASGFGIQHLYTFPAVKTGNGAYNLKEEKTVFTAPVAFGLNPSVSLGGNIRLHLVESQCIDPVNGSIQGNAVYADAMVAALFKISQRFKAGVTVSPGSLYMDAKEKGDSGDFSGVDRSVPFDMRLGIAMYPVKWGFFFADLQYQKYREYPQPQPGFFLGGQLNKYGPLPLLSFMPHYGMTMISAGYSHEPYNRLTNTQARYFSLGAGYFLDNIYVRWSLRFNVEPKEERVVAVGLPGRSVRVTDYSLVMPLFFTVGYRF